MNKEPTLNEVLTSLGYRTEDAGHSRKNIIRDGTVCFTGRAHNVWAWLHETGQIEGGKS